jgi:hypothetical protein
MAIEIAVAVTFLMMGFIIGLRSELKKISSK